MLEYLRRCSSPDSDNDTDYFTLFVFVNDDAMYYYYCVYVLYVDSLSEGEYLHLRRHRVPLFGQDFICLRRLAV